MKTLNISLFLLIILSIFSCKKKDDSIDVKASGYVQKGPFVSGSQITIQELDDWLVPTGKTYITTTNDDFGSFNLNSTISSRYIEVIANGYYFNEVTGALSTSPITLRALAETSNASNININILTTLTRSRIEYLMNHNDFTFQAARATSEQELLSVFNISATNVSSFTQMNIAGSGTSNAILLAISLTLQSDNSVAELSELISKISLDLREDGDIDDQNIYQEIRNNSQNLNLSSVRNNIENRYASLGQNVSIPRFEDYLDMDGDSILNKNDTDQYIMIEAGQGTNYMGSGNVIYFNNKLWLSVGPNSLNGIYSSSDAINWQYEGSAPFSSGGSGYSNNDRKCLPFNNKVWNFDWRINYSSDCLNWQQSSAPWGGISGGSTNQGACVFNNKLNVIAWGGDSIYSSTDGVQWDRTCINASWGNIMQSFDLIEFKNKLWMIGAIDDLNNSYDLWNSDDGINWTNHVTNFDFGTYAQNFNPIVYNNKLWLFYGDVYVSNDGINYDKYIKGPNEYIYFTFVFDNKLWIMGGNKIYCILKYSDWKNNQYNI